MTLSTTTINAIKNASLDVFDDVEYIGLSETDTQDAGDEFTGDVFRKLLTEKNKTAPDTYNFESVIGLTEAVGYTIDKFGFLKESTGNNLMVSQLLDTPIEKTELLEFNIGFELTLDVIDNTGATI